MILAYSQGEVHVVSKLALSKMYIYKPGSSMVSGELKLKLVNFWFVPIKNDVLD